MRAQHSIMVAISLILMMVFSTLGCVDDPGFIDEGECPSSDENQRTEMQLGDYKRHANTPENTKYIRVISDSLIEVVYDEDENGDIRVETYNVRARNIVESGR